MGKRKRIEKRKNRLDLNVVFKKEVTISIEVEDAIVIEGRMVGAKSTDGRIIFVERYEERHIIAKEIGELLSKKKVVVCNFRK